MTTAHKVTVALCVVLAVLLGCAGYAYVQDKIALARHDEQTKANAGELKGLQDANKAVAAQMEVVVSTLGDLKRSTRTTTQIVQAAPQVITLPAAVKEVTKAEAAVSGSGVKEGDLVIPAESAKAWFDAQVDCKANAVRLDACGKTHVNDVAALAVKDKQIAEDAVVIKGGTKWQRFRAAAKWAAVGAGVGAVSAVAARR